jgi:hypothetical protein
MRRAPKIQFHMCVFQKEIGDVFASESVDGVGRKWIWGVLGQMG